MGWRENEDEMSDIITAEFGQPCQFVPGKKDLGVNGPTSYDTTGPNARPSYEIMCVFEWVYSEVRILKGQDVSKAVPGAVHSQRHAYITFEKRDMPAGAKVKQGDIVALEYDGENLSFEIADGQPDGQGRIKCPLNQWFGRARI